MKLAAQQLERAAGMQPESARLWLLPVNKAGEACALTTPARWAMWLAQCGHESGGFRQLRESLNYTPDGLMATWPGRYTPELARQHGRSATRSADQRAIALHVYGARLGNRPGTEDGWAYIGRGCIQVTGRENYLACGKHMGIDLAGIPELLAEDRMIAATSTAWFWDTRRLNALADRGDVEACTRAINGGTHGLEDRRRRYGIALTALGGDASAEVRRILGRM